MPCPERFGYVAESSPAALAANIGRAVESIVAEAGGHLPCEQSALAARDLCYALEGFVVADPTAVPSAERAAAFLGVFKPVVLFLREAGEPPPEPEVKYCTMGLAATLSPPVAKLCAVLFWAHEQRQAAGEGLDGELLAGLELALETYGAGGEGYCLGEEAVLGFLATKAPALFRLDPVWTQQRLFAHLAEGDVYRRHVARLLVRFGRSSFWPYLVAVRPYVLGFFEDIEAVFGDDRDSRNGVLRWLHQFADRAFEDNDEATSARITDLLRVMPDTDRGNFIGMLGYRFDEPFRSDYEELSDRELYEALSLRLSTPQFIRTFWPPEPQCQSGYATMQFVDLIFDAGEHAEAIFEACRDFLVPVTQRQEQGHVYSKLAYHNEDTACVQANPTIMAGIIDRVTNEHSVHLKELTELKYHLTSETPPAAAP